LEQQFVWKDAFNLTKLMEIFQKVPGIILALTIGGVIVGLPVAWAGYLIAYSAVGKYQKSIKEKLQMRKQKIKGKIRSRKNRKAQKKRKPNRA
jgi:hypothetical protein